MKAKEYIAAYRAGLDPEDVKSSVTWLLLEMMKEAMALGMARSGTPKPNDDILIPITREFDFKWRAIAREIDHLNPNGWREYWNKRGVTW